MNTMAEPARTISWIDRLFPARIEERRKHRKLDAALRRMESTANGIRKDHGLETLIIDIEQARGRGVDAMESGNR